MSSQTYRVLVEVDGIPTLDTDNLDMAGAQARYAFLLQSIRPMYLQIVPIDSINIDDFSPADSSSSPSEAT